MTENVELPMVKPGYKTPIILLCQFALIAAIALITAYVILPAIPFAKQGYMCDDPSLKYKYYSNTVDISIVHLTGHFLIILTIFFIECQPFYGLSGSKLCSNNEPSLNQRLVTFSYAFFASELGLSMNFLLYQIVKYSCGRLRPHFFDVCRPNTECTPGTYVSSFVCTGTDAKLINDSHLSFYSGHASTAFYYATFLAIYTQLRLQKKLLHCLPILYISNVLFYAAAAFVAVSRIIDNKHHNSDVVFGSLIGTVIGATVVLVYLREVLLRVVSFKPYIAPESIVATEHRRFQSVTSEPTV